MSSNPTRRRSATTLSRRLPRSSVSNPAIREKEQITEIACYDEAANERLAFRGTRRSHSSDGNEMRKYKTSDARKNQIGVRTRPTRSRSDDVSGTIRPKLCKDQVRSMRMLLVNDPQDGNDHDGEAKKSARKKKARELNEQMEKRALLNLQFNSIQQLLDGTKFLGDLEGNPAEHGAPANTPTDMRRRRVVENDDHTVHFDPFAVNDISSQVAMTRKLAPSRELSFRDLLGRNQHKLKSFRDLTRIDDDIFNNQSPCLPIDEDFNSNTIFDDDEDDPFAVPVYDEGEHVDFETVVWGVPHVNDKRINVSDALFKFPDSSHTAVTRSSHTESACSISKESDRLSPGPKSRIRSNQRLSRDAYVLPKLISSDLEFDKAPSLMKKSGIFAKPMSKSSRRCSSGSNDSERYLDSVNTNTSKKSETDSPSIKKKKKILVSARSERLTHHDLKERSRTPLATESSPRRGVERKKSGSRKQNAVDPDVRDSVVRSKDSLQRTASPAKRPGNRQSIHREHLQPFDYDPQKTPSVRDLEQLQHDSKDLMCDSLLRLDTSNSSLPTEDDREIAFGGYGKIGYVSNSSRKTNQKKVNMEDEYDLETSNHIFVY